MSTAYVYEPAASLTIRDGDAASPTPSFRTRVV